MSSNNKKNYKIFCDIKICNENVVPVSAFA